MNRSFLWLCTFTAAAAATISDARAFNVHGPATRGVAHFVAGPELHGPGGGAPPVVMKPPPAPPFGNYSFSGNSFNLSVTRNGRSPTPPVPPPPPPPPGGGFFGHLFNWW